MGDLEAGCDTVVRDYEQDMLNRLVLWKSGAKEKDMQYECVPVSPCYLRDGVVLWEAFTFAERVQRRIEGL